MTDPVRAARIIAREELCLMEHVPDPCTIVIFGASGDLSFRKLMPSLFDLHVQGLMPDTFRVIGVARSAMSDEQFRRRIGEVLPKDADAAAVKSFAGQCSYLSGGYDDESTYGAIAAALAGVKAEGKPVSRVLFYLSVPPFLYPTIIGHLGDSGLARPAASNEGWSRLVVEKPFGTDLESAKRLNEVVHSVFPEEEVYRIDHYLGKETVQNIMIFRFGNSLFEPTWNRHYIDHVQITAAEQLGVEHRAGYYDSSGVLRDMFQNHLLQLLALIAMEPPVRFEANAVRDKKVDVFRAVPGVDESAMDSSLVRGQYEAGTAGGSQARAYRDEKGVPSGSNTATYAAMKLEVDNWRWRGVPFYLRSGKRLAHRFTEIAVQYRRVPTSIFKPLLNEHLAPNVLRFRIQPNEGIAITFESKHPGPKLCLSTVTMDFGYQGTFGAAPPEAYQRLILDAMLGDPTLFAREDGVEECWRILAPFLSAAEEAEGLHPYPAGSRGPAAAAELLSADGREWYEEGTK